MYRVFTEKKADFNVFEKKLMADIAEVLKISVSGIRRFLRYDIEGISKEDFLASCDTVFSEPPCDDIYLETVNIPQQYKVFAVEYLEGQYDQRADSAEQCV